jgi:hypothetical protein
MLFLNWVASTVAKGEAMVDRFSPKLAALARSVRALACG